MKSANTPQQISPMFFQAVFYNNPDLYPPMINGAHLLAEAGFGQEIFCTWFDARLFPPPSDQYPHSAHVTRIDVGSQSNWRKYLYFVREVWKQKKPHAVFFVGYDMHGLISAWLLAARYRRPLVYYCYDFVEDSRKMSLPQTGIKVIERLLARSADLVIVPDFERAKVVAEQLHLGKFPLIVANAPRRVPDRSRNRLEVALGERAKHFSRVVFRQGRIGVNHCLEITLRSMPLWAGEDWGFVIMGPGEEDYKEMLRNLARTLGVEDRLVILPTVHYADVSQFTVGAHLGHALYEPATINSQYFMTASNKIMEYVAAGLPILVADTPSGTRLLDNYHNGVSAQIDSPESIACAVNQVLGNPALASEMAEGSRRAFAEEFNFDRQFEPVLQIFRQWAGSATSERA